MYKKFLWGVFFLTTLTLSGRADTVDSLYQIVRSGQRADYKTANRLIIALDAEGCVDSLYTFQRSDATPYIRMIVSQYMGVHYNQAFHYALAAQAYTDMAQQARELKDLGGEADALSEAACQYHLLGDFEQAMKLQMAELRIDSLLNDTIRLSSVFNNLAATHMAAGYRDDAEKYITEAIRIEKMRPTPTKLAIRYGSAAEIFNKQNKTEEALHYAEMAYELDRKANNPIGIARRMSQMADIYVHREEYDRAETYYLRAIDTLEAYHELHSLTIDYKQLGNLYQRQGKYEKSVENYLRSKKLALQTGNRFFLAQVERLIANSYHKLGKDSQAYECMVRAIELNDSIHTDKLAQMASEQRIRYSIDEHENKTAKLARIVHWQQWLLLLFLLLAVGTACYAYLRRRRIAAEETTRVEDAAREDSQETHSAATEQIKERRPHNRSGQQFLVNVSNLIHERMNSEKLTVATLAKHMSMSQSQFTHRLQEASGENANTFITRVKMEKATRLLKDTNMSVKEIAYECGFDEPSYFIRVFRTMFGMTPQQFRNTPIVDK